MLKKLIKCLVSTAMVFSMAMVSISADEEDGGIPDWEIFLADLQEDGYAELDAWKVEKVAGRENVYHMDEETKALPGGATDEDGNMNNPSSIYFVVGEDEVLIIDGGNPCEVGSTKEYAAKTIVAAMTQGKDTYIALTHNHGDHIGLVYNETVFEDVNVKGVYVGSEDNSGTVAPLIAKYPVTEVGQAEGEVAKFTVGGRTYDVVDIHAHTAGSVVFVDSENEIVFTGDSIGSGAIWVLWKIGEDPIGTLSAGVTALQAYVKVMKSPKILAGHRWQQFWANNAQRPNEMTIQYLNDMNAVISGLQNGTTKKDDYSSVWPGAIELSANGCKAKIDTLPELCDTYLEKVNTYSAAENVWIFNEGIKLSIETSNNTQAAKFMVFADQALTKEEAKTLIDEMGISKIIENSASVAYVIGPQGEDYTEADLTVAMDILAKKFGPTTNLNLVGIGKGATFVNKYMTQKCWGVAGIMTYGGEAGATPVVGVPAYVSKSPTAVADAYIAANKGAKTSTEGTMTTYVNPDSRFEVTVVNTADEDVNTAFQNAWKTILSKFGRIGNIATEEGTIGTWYLKNNSVEREYMLIDSVDCIVDQFERTVVTTDFDGDGIDSLYYVYVPKTVKNAEAGTIPAVFLMHGNTNDPRTQFDTSGWAQVAIEEGIILVCPEWQGHTYQAYTYDPMTSDANMTSNSDFIKCVNEVVANYKQIDASRLYISGLSAGCRNTSNNAFSNTSVFAAGAGQSGPFKYDDASYALLDSYVEANKDTLDFPIIYFAGDRDEYLTDWNKLEGSGGAQIAQLFAKLNNVEINSGVEKYSKLYGIEWQTYSENVENEGTCQIIGGTFENDKGVEVSMNRICTWGHWNYMPDAKLMWNFMKKYSRNTETGEIIRLDKTNPTPEDPTPTTPDQPGGNTGGTTGGTTGGNTGGTTGGNTSGTTTPTVGIYNNVAYVAVATIALAGAAYVAFKKKED